MKNKILNIILAVCVVFSFALLGLNFSPKAEAHAFSATEATYTISNRATGIDVTKGTAGAEFEANLTSLTEAFEAILADDSLEATATVEIVFNNLTLSAEEQITLSRNFIFSGTLNTANASSLFVSNNTESSDQSITCDSLTLTNNAELEDFAFFEVNGNKVNFTFNNTHFNLASASADISHAVRFNTNSHTLLLKGEVSHDTTYFYNFKQGTLLYVDQDNNGGDDFYADADGNPVSTTERLKISIPYTANNALISNNIEYSNILILELIADGDFFTASSTANNSSLYISVESRFTFNTNGGTFATEGVAPSILYYNNTTPYTFPDKTKIVKANHHFIGWYGQIEYQGTTYYFDEACLETYVTGGSDSSTIPTIFKTDLSTFEASTSFTSYLYSSLGTEEQYAKYYPVIIAAENGQPATFIAKWALDTYTVSFETNSDTVISSEVYEYGSTITEPATIPTKTGYTFDKWFKDEDLTIPFEFSTETVPAENITLYAGYTINSYTITFVTNTTESIFNPISYNYLQTIPGFETPTKLGYTFDGWFLDEALTEPFSHSTMPAENLTAYAKFSILRLKVYFNTLGGNMINETYVDYGSFIEKPADPTKTGFVFAGWHYDYNCSNDKRVTWNNEDKLQITVHTTLYARWNARSYSLVFFDGSSMISTASYGYNADIEYPANPTKPNHTFGGWYTDSTFTTQFTLTKMPAESTSVYAKWLAKQVISIDESVQTYVADTINPTFELESEIKNFIIKYKVNNEWVIDAPTNVGTYDVMITRNEDETYARYEKIISGGYVIEPIIANYTWLIAILFSVFVLEILVAVAVRILRKLKKNMVITSLAILTGNTLIPSNQVVLLIISAICAVAGFVVMCYQLVKLHRTLPVALVTPEDEDTTMQKHFAHSEKVISKETHEYTAQDVEDMLLHDSVGHSIKAKHNLDNLEKEETKEKVPIGPVAYSEEHDNIQKVEDAEEITENSNLSNVEIVEDEFVENNLDDNERLFNSDDPFLRKDPTEYSNPDEDNE